MPGGPEWFFIIAIVILLFGAKKLPELARGLGQSFGEFRKAKDEFDRELHRSTTPAPAPTNTASIEVKEATEKEAHQPTPPTNPTQNS